MPNAAVIHNIMNHIQFIMNDKNKISNMPNCLIYNEHICIHCKTDIKPTLIKIKSNGQL